MTFLASFLGSLLGSTVAVALLWWLGPKILGALRG